MSHAVYGTILKEFNNRITLLEGKIADAKPNAHVPPPPPPPSPEVDTKKIISEVSSQVSSQISSQFSEQINDLKRNFTNVLTIKFETMLQNAIAEVNKRIDAIETKQGVLSEDAIPENDGGDDLDLEMMVAGGSSSKKKNKNKSK